MNIVRRLAAASLCFLLLICMPITAFADDSVTYIENVSPEEYEANYKNIDGYSIDSIKTLYRYRNKETKNSGQNSLSGYTYVKNVVTGTTYGSWTTSKPTAKTTNSDSVKTVISVESKNTYVSYAYHCTHKDWYWNSTGGKCGSGYATNQLLEVYSSKSLSASGYSKDSDGSYKLPVKISKGTGLKIGEVYFIKDNGSSVSSYTSKSSKGTYLWHKGTAYVYRTKTVKSYNVFEKWGTWSGWTETPATASSTKQVETKTVYRIKYVKPQSGSQGSCTHSWKVYTKNPTCSEQGLSYTYCSLCGTINESSRTILSPNENLHKWSSDMMVISQPTCTHDGIGRKCCAVCGAVSQTEVSIPATGHKWGDWWTETKAAVNQSGREERDCEYCGEKQFRSIAPLESNDISDGSVAAATAAKIYTGGNVSQDPNVYCNGELLRKGIDYTITYKNNTSVGTATIIIIGRGAYTGTITRTFKINPKPVSLSKLTRKKKSFVANWPRISEENQRTITGIQIQFSTDKKFKKKNQIKTVNTKNKNATRATVKKLKRKKTYYVRIRTYKTIGSQSYYSTWSKVKKVKTK